MWYENYFWKYVNVKVFYDYFISFVEFNYSFVVRGSLRWLDIGIVENEIVYRGRVRIID